MISRYLTRRSRKTWWCKKGHVQYVWYASRITAGSENLGELEILETPTIALLAGAWNFDWVGIFLIVSLLCRFSRSGVIYLPSRLLFPHNGKRYDGCGTVLPLGLRLPYWMMIVEREFGNGKHILDLTLATARGGYPGYPPGTTRNIVL